jgi:hypothetical protein
MAVADAATIQQLFCFARSASRARVMHSHISGNQSKSFSLTPFPFYIPR